MQHDRKSTASRNAEQTYDVDIEKCIGKARRMEPSSSLGLGCTCRLRGVGALLRGIAPDHLPTP